MLRYLFLVLIVGIFFGCESANVSIKSNLPSSTNPNNTAPPTTSTFVKFQAADFVVGQPTALLGAAASTPSPSGMSFPFGVFATNTQLFLSDQTFHRVAVYNTLPIANGFVADFAVGQAAGSNNLYSAVSGSSPSELDGNNSIFVFGGTLLVADESNNKVLIWNSVNTTGAGAPADRALGTPSLGGIGGGGCQLSELESPNGVFVTPSGKVLVADSGNHRVLIWNSLTNLTTGSSADLALGNSGCSSGTTATDMNWPVGVWSDDVRLIVSDYNNMRVLVWNSFPTSSSTPPDFVLGQMDFTSATTYQTTQSSLQGPWGVSSDGKEIYVVDFFSNRILIWKNFPTSNNQNADLVLGQMDFTNSTENDDNGDGNIDANPTARTLKYPRNLHYHNKTLYVTDTGNARVSVFKKY